MRTPSSALLLIANPFLRTAGENLARDVDSHDNLRLGGKNLDIYQIVTQHVARDNSGLNLAKRKDDGQYYPSVSAESNRKQDNGNKNLSGHSKCIPEYWNRNGGWLQAVSRES